MPEKKPFGRSMPDLTKLSFKPSKLFSKSKTQVNEPARPESVMSFASGGSLNFAPNTDERQVQAAQERKAAEPYRSNTKNVNAVLGEKDQKQSLRQRALKSLGLGKSRKPATNRTEGSSKDAGNIPGVTSKNRARDSGSIKDVEEGQATAFQFRGPNNQNKQLTTAAAMQGLDYRERMATNPPASRAGDASTSGSVTARSLKDFTKQARREATREARSAAPSIPRSSTAMSSVNTVGIDKEKPRAQRSTKSATAKGKERNAGPSAE